MLKIDFHIHTADDCKESHLGYSSKDIIDKASKLGFNAISITQHDWFQFNDELFNYAKSKNILLIPGIEKTIEGVHVLLINLKSDLKILKLSELSKLPDDVLIIAPHPFYPFGYSLKNKLLKHRHLFDAIEFSAIYLNSFNKYNKKVLSFAKKFGKPVVGNSDLHNLNLFNCTYTLVDSKLTVNSIIESIKVGKVVLKTKPLSLSQFIKRFNVFFIPLIRSKLPKIVNSSKKKRNVFK